MKSQKNADNMAFGRIISAPTKQPYCVMPCRGGYQPPDEKMRENIIFQLKKSAANG